MIGREPPCLNCHHFKGGPQKYGDSAKCEIVGEIPEKIYWNGAKCDRQDVKRSLEDIVKMMEEKGKM